MDAVLGARNYDCFHMHSYWNGFGVLVEVLLASGGGTGGTAGKPPKDEKGLKEWVKYKLKASTLLLGRLRVKATEMLP